MTTATSQGEAHEVAKKKKLAKIVDDISTRYSTAQDRKSTRLNSSH